MYYSRSSSIFKHYTFIHHHLVTFKRKKALYLFVITYLKCVKKKKRLWKESCNNIDKIYVGFFKKEKYENNLSI